VLNGYGHFNAIICSSSSGIFAAVRTSLSSNGFQIPTAAPPPLMKSSSDVTGALANAMARHCQDMICECKSEFVAEMMQGLRYEFQCHKHNHSAVTVKCVRL
jgi:hypothetical protein